MAKKNETATLKNVSKKNETKKNESKENIPTTENKIDSVKKDNSDNSPKLNENIEEFIKTCSLPEILDYEKACALVCKKYETSARIDNTDNFKFNRFKECYHYIFDEIERRVEIIYKQKIFMDEKN